MTLRKAIFGARVVDLMMLVLIAVGGLLLATERIAIGFDDPTCAGYYHGYSTSSIVPCNNATCVSIMGWPMETSGAACVNHFGSCDDGETATYFSAETIKQWFNCHGASSINYGVCDDECSSCAMVQWYKEGDCTTASKCSTGTMSYCGSATKQ